MLHYVTLCPELYGSGQQQWSWSEGGMAGMGNLLTFLHLQVPGLHTGEIFAKLEIYMWLGVTKYAKNCMVELPEEFKYLSESRQEITQFSVHSPPSWLSRDGEFHNLTTSGQTER